MATRSSSLIRHIVLCLELLNSYFDVHRCLREHTLVGLPHFQTVRQDGVHREFGVQQGTLHRVMKDS